MGFESDSSHPMNAAAVSDVVKKLLITFFRANIPFAHGLDIYGSIHVRSDDYDAVCCVLNEHCFKPDRASNSDDKPAMMNAGIQPVGTGANAPNSSEYVPGWKVVGTRKSCGKKPVSSLAQSEGRADADVNDGNGDDDDDDETKAKHKRVGLSRKLSKLNRASIEIMNYAVQSIFPEPLTFGPSRNRTADDETLEAKQGCSVAEDALENDSTDKSGCRSDDQVNSDDPGIDLAMAATSEAYTPQKNDSRFDNDGEMADVDSNDSRDFDSVEKGVSYPHGSHQSFSQQLTPLSGSSALPVGFGEAEMFSQAAWLQSDARAPRGGNQAGYSNSFDGSVKTPGPLTSEKICMYCLKIFHTNLEMSQHIQQQHNSGFPLLDGNDERPYRPRYQNAYAYGASELDVDRQLTCSVCSLSFRSLDGLRCHENSKHSHNKLYKCQFCTQSFLTRQAAYTHRMKFHRLVPRNSRLLTGATARI